MQSVEMYFNDTITRYSLFQQAVNNLVQESASLNFYALDQGCQRLAVMHHDLQKNKEQMFTIMEFFGPGILDTSYIGELQRALNGSIAACDALYEEFLTLKGKIIPPSDLQSDIVD